MRVLLALLLTFAAAACRRPEPPPPLPARPAGELSTVLREKIEQAEAAIRAAPESAAPRAQLAMLYHANGFAAAALAAYRAVLARAPDDPDGTWHYLLALAAEESGEIDTAGSALRESLQRAPAYPPALLRSGDLRYKAGAAGEAIAFYRAALALDETCPEALLALARDELRQGHDTTALALLDRLAAAHPDYGSALSLKAQVLERRGERAAADALRRQGRQRKDPPPHDPRFDEMMRACVDVRRLGLRFEDALNAGRIDAALATLDRMQSLEPENGLTYRLRGFALAHSGRPEAAVAAYRAAVERSGDPALVYPGLVAALMKLGRFDEAAQAAREGLAKAPATAALLRSLAEIATRQGRRDEAETLLMRALALDDRDLDAHRALGRLQWDAARHDEALAHFERVVQLDPVEFPLRMLVGQHHLEQGRPASALGPLAEAAALAPADADARHLLALAWLRHGNGQARGGQFHDASASYDAALRVEPGNVEALTNQTRVRAHLRRLEEVGNSARPHSE